MFYYRTVEKTCVKRKKEKRSRWRERERRGEEGRKEVEGEGEKEGKRTGEKERGGEICVNPLKFCCTIKFLCTDLIVPAPGNIAQIVYFTVPRDLCTTDRGKRTKKMCSRLGI